jgi:hypothetical protein
MSIIHALWRIDLSPWQFANLGIGANALIELRLSSEISVKFFPYARHIARGGPIYHALRHVKFLQNTLAFGSGSGIRTMGLYFLRKILEFLCVGELCSHARKNSKIFRTKQESLPRYPLSILWG